MNLFYLIKFVYAAPVCPISNGFCITTESQGSNTCFTVHSKYEGWNGIGVGSARMNGADMYIGWQNSTGGITVGNFEGSGHTQPQENAVQNQITVSVPGAKPTWSKLSFMFCRPSILHSNGKSITATTDYIFAGSSTPPSGNVDKLGVTLMQHDIQGTFTPEATFGSSNNSTASNTTQVQSSNGGSANGGSSPQPILSPSSSFSFQKIVIVHGTLMFVAWVISPFIGIYISRFMKSALGHSWYILHVFFMAGVTACATIASFVLIILYSSDRFSVADSTVGDLHEKLGLTVIVLGYISNMMFDPHRTSIP
ncbi:hypothetical protein HDV06_001326, partial [Boothiomyces sp. JEL0866]